MLVSIITRRLHWIRLPLILVEIHRCDVISIKKGLPKMYRSTSQTTTTIRHIKLLSKFINLWSKEKVQKTQRYFFSFELLNWISEFIARWFPRSEWPLKIKILLAFLHSQFEWKLRRISERSVFKSSHAKTVNLGTPEIKEWPTIACHLMVDRQDMQMSRELNQHCNGTPCCQSQLRTRLHKVAQFLLF